MSSLVPSERLRRDLLSGRAVVAGVLSGTSADGIDVALMRFRASDAAPRSLDDLRAPVCLAFETRPFPEALGQRTRRAVAGDEAAEPRSAGRESDEYGDREPVSWRELALLDRDLGRAFGYAARDVAREKGLQLNLVGSHGQTLWHHDGVESIGFATLQLGDGDEVAEAAGCTTVSDFRRRDVAAGGHGAPLTALVDPSLFADAPKPCAILNLGGIANVTLLHRGGGVEGFDLGPACALLDGLARRLLGLAYDRDGAVASNGSVDRERVAERLQHPFFGLTPPKTTGRDTFGSAWLDEWVAGRPGLSVPDQLATATAFVAEMVRQGLSRSAQGLRGLYLAGGGVHNARLVAEIAERVDLPLATVSELGVDPDAREALAFGCLAAARVLELPVSRREVTGAAPGRLLGKLCAGFPA